jgi:arsenical-resistance protein 2
LYPSIPTLFDLFAAAKIKKVVWYCGQYSKRVVSTAVLCSIAQLCVIGSSRGRGNRAAGWFADYLKQRGEKGDGMESLVLEGGVKGWASAGEEYVRLMDDNDAAVWAG